MHELMETLRATGLKFEEPSIFYLDLTEMEALTFESILVELIVRHLQGENNVWEKEHHNIVLSILGKLLSIQGKMRKTDYKEMEENDRAET